MPRINIEDQFWIDIIEVAVRVGDKDRAIGNAVRWFRFAQEKLRNGEGISTEAFAEHGFLDALIPMFAVRAGDGIVPRGADKYFGWLMNKSKAGQMGGQASVETRKAKYGSAQPSKHTEADRSTIKHTEPSSSSSSSKDLKEKLKNDPEWAQFWASCPRKVAKGKAMESWVRCRKTYTPEDITTALGKLKAEKIKSGESYPYPATFLNNLGDFLEPDYGQTAKEDSEQLRLRSR